MIHYCNLSVSRKAIAKSSGRALMHPSIAWLICLDLIHVVLCSSSLDEHLCQQQSSMAATILCWNWWNVLLWTSISVKLWVNLDSLPWVAGFGGGYGNDICILWLNHHHHHHHHLHMHINHLPMKCQDCWIRIELVCMCREYLKRAWSGQQWSFCQYCIHLLRKPVRTDLLLSRCMQYWLKNHWPGSLQTLSQQWMPKTLRVFMLTTIFLIE